MEGSEDVGEKKAPNNQVNLNADVMQPLLVVYGEIPLV